MRRTLSLVGAGAVGAAVVVLALGGGTTTTGASFTARAEVTPAQTVGAAQLGVVGLSGSRNAAGQVEVSWPTPPRAEKASYLVVRYVGYDPLVFPAPVTRADGTTRFLDDVTAEPEGYADRRVTAVSAGDQHTCAVVEGTAWCWGTNSSGQLGDGTTSNSDFPVAVDASGVLSGRTVTAISAGTYHTCAIADGRAFCWGSNGAGQLGNGTTTATTRPVAVGGALVGKTVTGIDAGSNHTCAVADGAAYCWGYGGGGILGRGSTADSRTPVAVSTTGVLAGRTVTAVETASLGSCAVADGAAFCWGDNDYGQLGNGTTSASTVPVAVAPDGALAGKTVTAIEVGSSSACAIASGQAYCWGNNESGRLGDGTQTSSAVPVPVSTSGVLAGRTVTSISITYSHTCAVAGGAAFCWGSAASGALGFGTTVGGSRTTPVAVSTSGVLAGTSVTAIAAGLAHTCAVASAVATCWGAYRGGARGDGTTVERQYVPVAVLATWPVDRPLCKTGWAVTPGRRCAPGRTVEVTYHLTHRAAGWVSRMTQVTPAWRPTWAPS